eukprot:scaffold124398_cov30-Tisochrysis_lutea.AAC.1
MPVIISPQVGVDQCMGKGRLHCDAAKQDCRQESDQKAAGRNRAHAAAAFGRRCKGTGRARDRRRSTSRAATSGDIDRDRIRTTSLTLVLHVRPTV